MAKRPDPDNDDQSFAVIKAPELARMLEVSERTLRQWRIDGTGPPFIKNTSRSYVYLLESVREWMKTRERSVRVSYPPKRPKRRTTRADQSRGKTQLRSVV